MKLLAMILLTLGVVSAQTGNPAAAVPRMEEALQKTIVDFWYPKSIDKTHGGYTIRFNADGTWKGDGPKMIVTQARHVWMFARLARAGYGDRHAMLAAADHGYRFLTTKMWDAANGGFYWEVDAAGNKTKPKKHLYGQSFALYAISEYAMASGRKDVLDFAVKFFELLERRSHDPVYGGYIEYFNEDWSAPPAGEASYMSTPTGLKLMNTHLHLMEAMTTFLRASKLPLARERLLELMTIESNSVVRKDIAACTDRYRRDWTPVLDGDAARVSYGHDLENIWLLVDAAEAAQVPVAPLMDLFRANFAYAMKYGWDEKDGGFWYFGAFNQPASGRYKSWWVQSEVLVSALTMFRLTKDAQYWRVFERTWSFVDQHQIDWKNGEWWETVTDQLAQRGDKGSIWKAGYHNGRAMIESIALLKGLAGGAQ